MIGLNSRERQLIKATLVLLTFRLHSRSWPSVRCFDLQIRVGSRFSQFRFGSDLNDEYRYRLRLRPVAIKVYIQKSRRNKNRLVLSKKIRNTYSQPAYTTVMVVHIVSHIARIVTSSKRSSSDYN